MAKEEGDLLVVELLSGKNLLVMDKNDRSDPFVITRVLTSSEDEKVSGRILHGNAVGSLKRNLYRSSTCFRTLHPLWNESYVFWIDPKQADDLRLQFDLYDWDRIGVDGMGKCSIPLSSLTDKAFLSSVTLPVLIDGIKQRTKETRKEGGNLEIQVVYIKKSSLRAHYIIAETHLADLMEMFFHRDASISVTARIAYSETTDEMANAICDLSESADRTREMLKELVRISVTATRQESTLFRTNSTATKAIRMTFTQHGVDFIQKSIGDLVSEILEDPSGFELNTVKMPPEEIARVKASLGIADDPPNILDIVVEANQKRLNDTCLRFVHAICSSDSYVPPLFRKILEDVRLIVADRFPESSLLSVGGFLFLRFIVPAIATPEHFGVTKVANVTAPQRRALTLISKVVQNMANNTTFGAKEGFMTLMNPTIESGTGSIQSFLDRISTVSKGEESVVRKSMKSYGWREASHKKSPQSRPPTHSFSPTAVDSMAYFLSRADDLYDKIYKEVEAEGVAENISLLQKIKHRIVIGKQTAEAGTSSLIQSITLGDRDMRDRSPPPFTVGAASTVSAAAFTVPMAPSALAGVSNRIKNEVVWRAGDRAENSDSIEVSPNKSFEFSKDLASGSYTFRFEVMPSNKSMMHMSFDIVVESKSGGEILKHFSKHSPGDDEITLNFDVSAGDVPATFKFSCATGKGFLPIRFRACLTVASTSLTPLRNSSPHAFKLLSSDHRKREEGLEVPTSKPQSLSPSKARTHSPSKSRESEKRSKSPRHKSPLKKALAQSDIMNQSPTPVRPRSLRKSGDDVLLKTGEQAEE